MRLMQLIGLRHFLPKRLRRTLLKQWNALLAREQHFHEHRFYRQFVSDGDLVFDIGANDGLKTDAFLLLGARVLSVEPNPVCAAKIRQSFLSEINAGRLAVEEVAVGESQGTLSLQLFEEDSTITSGSELFVSVAQQKGLISTSVIEVEILTIDQLAARFGHPVFLKIDVEGMDAQVLRGCHSRPTYISFEFNTSKALWGGVGECLEEASRLEFASANFTGPGTPRLQLSCWVPIETIQDRIQEWAEGRETFGDVIIK
jgi:FkbM family methyltransferase